MTYGQGDPGPSSPPGDGTGYGPPPPSGNPPPPFGAVPPTGENFTAPRPSPHSYALPPTGRPGVVHFAVVMLVLLALLRIATSVMTLTSLGDVHVFILHDIGLGLVQALLLILAAVLVGLGREGGRILAFALCGAVAWAGIYSLVVTVSSVVREPGGLPSHLDWYVGTLLSLIGLAAAVAAILSLAGARVGRWFQSRTEARRGLPPPPAGVGYPPAG